MADLPELYETLSKEQNSPDLTERRMFRRIMREMRMVLNSDQLALLLFIFDRTYAYGKVAEVISERHFLEGVRGPEGNILHPPLRCSRASLYRDMRALLDNDIIKRKTDKRSNRTTYMINPMWSPEFATENVIERQTLHNDLVSPVRRPRLSRETSLSQPRDLEHTDSNMRIKTGSGAPLPPGLQETVTNVSAKSAAARTKAKSKGNASAYCKVWEDAYKEAYPDEPFFTFTRARMAMLRKALERGVPVAFRVPFVEYVVKDFDAILRRRYAWMKQRPQFPTVEFVVKQVETLFRDYQEKDDPNRGLRRAIREAEPAEPKPSQQNTGVSEVKRLQLQLAKQRALNEALIKERSDARAAESAQRRDQAKRLVLKRRKASDEFGSWDDE